MSKRFVMQFFVFLCFHIEGSLFVSKTKTLPASSQYVDNNCPLRYPMNEQVLVINVHSSVTTKVK
jgi:hypothetical protein